MVLGRYLIVGYLDPLGEGARLYGIPTSFFIVLIV